MAEPVAGFLEQWGPLLILAQGAIYFVAMALGSYTLQAISDKTDAAPSWICWVPFLQMHAFVRASETTWTALLGWVVSLVAVLVLSAIAGSSGLAGAATLLTLAFAIGSLVYFCRILWRLAERRDLSGWVGIACLIPLLGLLFYLYIAFHDGPVRPSPVGVVVALALSVASAIGFGQDLERLRALAGQEAEVAQESAGSGERSSGLLSSLGAWLGGALGPEGYPADIDIPERPECEPGTRAVGSAPPHGLEMWCEREDGGVRHGWYMSWYADGSLRRAGRFVDGARQGTWTRFWKNGARKAQVNFENDREHGLLVLWRADGERERMIRYEHGEPGPL